MKTIRILIAITLISGAGLAQAHSGGTDRQGCHLNHKTGARHCH